MEKIISTVEEISALRAEIGQSEKKITNSAQEFAKTPERGEFSHIGSKEFDIPEVGIRVSLGLYTKEGEFVSENSIFANTVTDEVVEIKNGSNKGKFMLKQARISGNDVWEANSQNKRLLSLVGKKFTTESVDGKALKAYTPEVMFAADKKATSVTTLKQNTEPKVYHKFMVSE